MTLADFLTQETIALALPAADQETALRALLALFGQPPQTTSALYHLLVKREALGSTGIGAGVAIPHCRSPLVDRLRIAYGRHPAGVAWDAVDGGPVHHVFLIVAPPVEISNLYLPALGRLAQFCRHPANLNRLALAEEPGAVHVALEEAGV